MREKVYSILKKVPSGKVITYKELARLGGTSARAVGRYMKENKDSKNIPCFKVVRSDGYVGEYSAGGKERKIELLRRDGIRVDEEKINLERFLCKF